MSSLWWARSASAVKKTPASRTQVPTATTPPTSEVGISQDPHRSPRYSNGTRPEAMEPATVPRKNGVISDEPANTAWLRKVLPTITFSHG